MDTIRSLKEIRKQYKEKALAASKVSAGPRPSPPVSECDYYSTATKYTDDEESKEVESEKDETEVHSKMLFFNCTTPTLNSEEGVIKSFQFGIFSGEA